MMLRMYAYGSVRPWMQWFICSDVMLDSVLIWCICQWVDDMFDSRCVYWFRPWCYGIIARVTYSVCYVWCHTGDVHLYAMQWHDPFGVMVCISDAYACGNVCCSDLWCLVMYHATGWYYGSFMPWMSWMYMYLMALILSGHDVIGCSAIFSILGYTMINGSMWWGFYGNHV